MLPALVGEVSGGARTDIALAGCGLTTVPEALRGLTGLRRLDLSGNRITSLPAWLGEVSGLDVLDLRETGSPSSLPSWPGWAACGCSTWATTGSPRSPARYRG